MSQRNNTREARSQRNDRTPYQRPGPLPFPLAPAPPASAHFLFTRSEKGALSPAREDPSYLFARTTRDGTQPISVYAEIAKSRLAVVVCPVPGEVTWELTRTGPIPADKKGLYLSTQSRNSGAREFCVTHDLSSEPANRNTYVDSIFVKCPDPSCRHADVGSDWTLNVTIRLQDHPFPLFFSLSLRLRNKNWESREFPEKVNNKTPGFEPKVVCLGWDLCRPLVPTIVDQNELPAPFSGPQVHREDPGSSVPVDLEPSLTSTQEMPTADDGRTDLGLDSSVVQDPYSPIGDPLTLLSDLEELLAENGSLDCLDSPFFPKL